MMKRTVSIASLALVLSLAACQDGGLVPNGAPDLRVVDGSPGNLAEGFAAEGDFFFRPPIVPEPATFDPTQFNPTARPKVTISLAAHWSEELPGGDVRPELNGQCIVGDPPDIVREFSPDDLTIDELKSAFTVGWNTGNEGFTTDPATGLGSVYRICVQLGEGENTKFLGYRDVRPLDQPDGGSRDTGQEPIYDFNNGRNIPITFSVNAGADCEPGKGPTIADCDEFIVGSAGGTGICEAGTCGMTVPQGVIAEGEEVLVKILRFDGTSLVCDPDQDGTINYIAGLDLPQYEGCLDIDVEPLTPVFSGFGGEGVIVAACISEQVPAPLIDGLQLHHEYVDPVTQQEVIEVLPNAPFAGLTQEVCQPAPAGNSPFGALFDGLRKARRFLFPMIDPEPLVASDVGFGGRTALPEESPFVWAQPSAMSGSMTSSSGASGNMEIPVLDTETVTVTINVLSRDRSAFGENVHSPDEAYPFDVEGATVHVATPTGGAIASNPACTSEPGGIACVTDANGNVTLEWSFLESGSGDFTLTASGRGIGDPTTGPFGVHVGTVEDVELLGTGQLTFTANVCGNGFATINVTDGAFDDQWACAGDQVVPFIANLPQLDTDVPNAEARWVNDESNLYFAVRIQQDVVKDVNILSLQFDNNGSGNAVELYDDLIELELDLETQTIDLRDLYVTPNCVEGQSVCGNPDDPFNQVIGNDVTGNWFRYQDCALGVDDCLESEKVWYSVYELAHPFSQDPEEKTGIFEKQKGQLVQVGELSSDLQLVSGDQTGMFLFLRLGKGAQGNTQLPEPFGDYIPITIH